MWHVTEPGQSPGLLLLNLVLFSRHRESYPRLSRNGPWDRDASTVGVFERFWGQQRGSGEGTQQGQGQPIESAYWASDHRRKKNPGNNRKHMPHKYPTKEGGSWDIYAPVTKKPCLIAAPRSVRSPALLACCNSGRGRGALRHTDTEWLAHAPCLRQIGQI